MVNSESTIRYLSKESVMEEIKFEVGPTYAVAGGSSESILGVTDRLLSQIRSQLQKQIDNLPSKQVVLDAAAAAYDKFIAPIDIPAVPAAIEPWVDQMLKSIFLRLVASVYDQLMAL